MSDPRLRVCLVAPLPPPYGGISHWTSLILRYAQGRADVDLSVADTAARWRDVDDLAVWKRVIGGGLQLLRDIISVSRQLKTHPQALHITTSGQLGIIRDRTIMSMARLYRVPVIYHIRFGRVPALAESRSREWTLFVGAARRAHTVVAIDARTEKAIREHLPSVRVVRIPNCVDTNTLPEPSSVRSADHVMMYLGWVIPTKGIEELLQAWSELRPSGWRLAIVGPGNVAYQERLMAQYRPENVEILGARSHDEAMLLMSQADAFVLPSHTEGFPNAVVEAMALAKPIVATRVGAIPEMLSGGCGLLAEPKDAVSLAEALSRLLCDDRVRRELGDRAHARAISHYSIDAVFAQYMDMWRRAALSP